MSEGVNVQRPLTRRELREQERRAEQQRIAAEQAARAAAAADSATPVESALVAPAAQDAETASVDARTQAAAKAQGQQFTSRRERREAERAAALAEFNQRAEQAQIAAQQVATQSPELFADRAAKTKSSVAAQVQIHRVAINPIPNVASRPVTAPVSAAADEAATETSAQPAAVVATNTAAPAGIPVAPADEPKIEFAAAFASGGSLKATRRVRHSDGGRRASRVGGSMVAFGLIAGTVALGTGSAAAISAAAAADEGAAEVGEPNADQPAPQTLKVSQEETVSVAATRRSEVTAVTSIGTAHAANLAAGVKLPDSNAYTNDITANVQWPFPQGVQTTDPYGPRVSPFGGGSSWHGGVDFTPGEGTPIGSIADGRVSYISESGTTYGIYVEVEHIINGERVTSQYAHLQPGSISVKVGDVVQVGDQIAKVGNTGASTGPHLHLETLIDGGTVDPMYFLKKLNVAGVDVKVPEEVPTGGVALGAERRGVEESHALVDETFGN